MKDIIRKNPKEVLSALWIVLIINMIYNDIFSIIVEVVNKGGFQDIPGEVKTVMAIAAIVTNLPIMMVFFSRVLKYKINRLLNIIVGIFTIIYIWGGMSAHPHYIIVASIETVLALAIIRIAWQWKNEEE
jgi:hypothetical protein